MTTAKIWETKNTATTVQMNRLVFMANLAREDGRNVRAGNGIRSRLVWMIPRPLALLGLHALQRESEPQHRRVEQPAGIVPQCAGIRELREQFEYGVNLCRGRFHDHSAIEPAAPFDLHRIALDAPFRAPPAVRNGHDVTSQVRSLFSSASSSLFPCALPDCA